MDQYIPPPEARTYELKCLFEMRSHPIAGQIKRIDGLVANLLLFRIAYAEHSCRCED